MKASKKAKFLVLLLLLLHRLQRNDGNEIHVRDPKYFLYEANSSTFLRPINGFAIVRFPWSIPIRCNMMRHRIEKVLVIRHCEYSPQPLLRLGHRQH